MGDPQIPARCDFCRSRLTVAPDTAIIIASAMLAAEASVQPLPILKQYSEYHQRRKTLAGQTPVLGTRSLR